MTESTAEIVIEFWFGAEGTSEADQERLARRWFARSDEFDAEIRRRFVALIDAAMAGDLNGWASTARGRLALLLVLDQFPRNLYRDSPAAFAGDPAAQQHALEGLERGDDLALAPRYRPFCYLPLEHAEDLTLQHRCVDLFVALAADEASVPRERYQMYLDYARRHRDVIERFGRFPHRNRILGRPTRPAEQVYLDAGGGF
ncbi:MAG: hypothetical protein AMXMBFR59_38780 [Rhodanobacteraceae bacterium]